MAGEVLASEPEPETLTTKLTKPIRDIVVNKWSKATGKIIPTDAKWSQGAHLNFRNDGKAAKGNKTDMYTVLSRHSGLSLGTVRWYTPWRQYVFFPLNCILDKRYLLELAEFVEMSTTAQRKPHPLKSWVGRKEQKDAALLAMAIQAGTSAA